MVIAEVERRPEDEHVCLSGEEREPEVADVWRVALGLRRCREGCLVCREELLYLPQAVKLDAVEAEGGRDALDGLRDAREGGGSPATVGACELEDMLPDVDREHLHRTLRMRFASEYSAAAEEVSQR